MTRHRRFPLTACVGILVALTSLTLFGFRCDPYYELLSYSNDDGVLFGLNSKTGDETLNYDLSEYEFTVTSLETLTHRSLLLFDVDEFGLYRVDLPVVRPQEDEACLPEPEVTFVGNCEYNFSGTAICGDGTLYGLEGVTDKLFSIDPESCAATEIGDIGVDMGVIGLACDKRTNTLYAISGLSSGLYTIDRFTGEASLVGEIGMDMTSAGLEFDSFSGTLYATINSDLYELDPATAVPTFLLSPERGELPNLGGRLALISQEDTMPGPNAVGKK